MKSVFDKIYLQSYYIIRYEQMHAHHLRVTYWDCSGGRKPSFATRLICVDSDYGTFDIFI